MRAESIEYSDQTPEINKEVTINIKTKNIGDIFILLSDIYEYDYNFDNFNLNSFSYDLEKNNQNGDINIFQPEDYLNYVFKGYFKTLGYQNLSFSIDTDFRYEEIIENNNSIQGQIEVVPAASLPVYENITTDLQVKSIEYSEATPELDAETTITIRTRNMGERLIPISNIPDYEYDFDNFTLNSFSYSLDKYDEDADASIFHPGDYLDYIFKGSFKILDNKNLFFKIDPNNEYEETIETNNSIGGQLKVISYNDLTVDEIIVLPENISAGQKCTITVKIKNNGRDTAKTITGINSYEYDFQDFKRSKITSPFVSSVFSVLKGETADYVFEGEFTESGEKNLTFNVDVADQLEENDEENNFKTVLVNIYEKEDMDLAIDEIEFSSDNPVMNEDFEIVIKIKNIGSVDILTNEGFLKHDEYLNFTEDDVNFILSDFKTRGFSHDEYPTIDSPFSPDDVFEYRYNGIFNTFGKKELSFKFDRFNKIFEGDKENNASTTQITVYETQRKADDFDIIETYFEIISSSTALVKWKTNVDTDTSSRVLHKRVAFLRFQDEVETSADDRTTDHEALLEDLIPGVEYKYQIKAINGVVEKYSELFSFKVPVNDNLIITTPPATSQSSKATSINIIWSTNFASDSYVYYKKNSDPDYTKVWDVDNVIDHSISLDNLESGEYQYYITSTSKLDTGAQSDIYGFYFVDRSVAPQPIKKIIPEKTEFEKEQEQYQTKFDVIKNGSILYPRVKGRIVLLVESHGEAWYFNPNNNKKYFLGRPHDAYNIMHDLGIGITNANLEKIQIGDKYIPKIERKKVDYNFANKHKGKIFLQIESHGEAWYVNTTDLKRYYLGKPDDAFRVMRDLSIGMKNADFMRL